MRAQKSPQAMAEQDEGLRAQRCIDRKAIARGRYRARRNPTSLTFVNAAIVVFPPQRVLL
jgi:hypothetical protein